MTSDMDLKDVSPKRVAEELIELFHKKGLTMKIEDYIFPDPDANKSNKPSKPDAYIYRLMDDSMQEIGVVSITNTIEYNIRDEHIFTLHVRDIDVPQEHRCKGIARAILLYGLCHSIEKCPEINFSDLDDDTPFAHDNPRNLYYEFGYRFKQGDQQEKMLDLNLFKQNEMNVIHKKVLSTFLVGKQNITERTHSKSPNRNRSSNRKITERSRSRSRSRTSNMKNIPRYQTRYQTRSQTRSQARYKTRSQTSKKTNLRTRI